MKPVLILDAHWRRVDELFSDADLRRLHDAFDVVWGKDDPIPADVMAQALPDAQVLVAAEPRVDAETLLRAPKLRTIVEVSGAFPETIDYAACAARGVEVLSCAPGFCQSVAEMALAMTLAGARGLVAEHELFRRGEEFWLDDRDGRDFTVYGAKIGFIGYGAIARETHRLLVPFAPKVLAYDPWLPNDVAEAAGISLIGLDQLLAESAVVYVAAAPTKDNKGMINAGTLAQMRKGALLVLISRAHLVDFDALTQAVAAGHVSAAIDVFPSEPLGADHPIRTLPGVILSPHRAAAVPGGRQLIGNLMVKDLDRMAQGLDPCHLHRAAKARLSQVAGVGDASIVADMAANRA